MKSTEAYAKLAENKISEASRLGYEHARVVALQAQAYATLALTAARAPEDDVDLPDRARRRMNREYLERIEQLARNLTKIDTLPDGGIIIGPEGWEQLQKALVITA